MRGIIDTGASALSAVTVTKGVATAGACVGMLGVNEWAWVAAIIGSFFSLYLEQARKPSQIVGTIVEILAWAFAAALLAHAIEHVHWFEINKMTQQVPIGIRAGLLGLSIRWLVLTGKGVIKAKAETWSRK